MWRAAVIGLGNIGFLFNFDKKRKETWSHVSAYERCDKTQLIGAVEIDKKKTDLFKRQYPELPVFQTIQELMKNGQPDIVSICTPTHNHFSIVQELIKYPISGIFCEKPIALTLEEAKDIVNKCEQKKIVLAVNHTRRWDTNYLYSKKIIEEGRIGDIRATNLFYSGQVMNIGTHLFDVARMLIAKDVRIVSGISSNIENPDPDISGWLLVSENIPCSVISTGKREDLIFEIDILGSEGRLRILVNGEVLELFKFDESDRYSSYRELHKKQMEPFLKKDRFVDAIYDIVSVIEGKKDTVNCTGYDGLAALQISLSMIESARQGGRPVTVDTSHA